jgi:hypothetical protein
VPTLDGVQTPACVRLATLPTTRTYSPGGFSTPTNVLVHNAYHIAWEPSDTAALTPQPPAVTCAEGVKVWVPGSPLTSTACPTSSNDSSIPGAAMGFLMIGLPIVIVFLFLGCVGTCCYYSHKERREKRLRAARATREQNETGSGAPS